MNTHNPGALSGRLSTLLAASLLLVAGLLPGTQANAHESETDENLPMVSAHEAKRLARIYLCDAGYCSRSGPGAARISSTTRDAGTWVLAVRLSDGGAVFRQRHVLYIDAVTGVVSDTPPAGTPVRVAGERQR
jgi:hypothetical protein